LLQPIAREKRKKKKKTKKKKKKKKKTPHRKKTQREGKGSTFRDQLPLGEPPHKGGPWFCLSKRKNLEGSLKPPRQRGPFEKKVESEKAARKYGRGSAMWKKGGESPTKVGVKNHPAAGVSEGEGMIAVHNSLKPSRNIT